MDNKALPKSVLRLFYLCLLIGIIGICLSCAVLSPWVRRMPMRLKYESFSHVLSIHNLPKQLKPFQVLMALADTLCFIAYIIGGGIFLRAYTKKGQNKSARYLSLSKKLSIFFCCYWLLSFALFTVNSWGYVSTDLALCNWICRIAAILVSLLIIRNPVEAAKRKKEAKELRDKRFESGEMVGAERELYIQEKLEFIEMAYKHGDFTLIQADLLRAKYTGRPSATSILGVEKMMAASRRDEVNNAIFREKKIAEKNIIYSAAVGNAIGGLGGAMVGAASAASTAAEELSKLAVEQAKAEDAYREAMNK